MQTTQPKNENPKSKIPAGVTVAEVDSLLPRSYFVKRGDLARAFGLTRAELEALIPETFVPSPNPKFKRHRFVRSHILDVARRWETAGIFATE